MMDDLSEAREGRREAGRVGGDTMLISKIVRETSASWRPSMT